MFEKSINIARMCTKPYFNKLSYYNHATFCLLKRFKSFNQQRFVKCEEKHYKCNGNMNENKNVISYIRKQIDSLTAFSANQLLIQRLNCYFNQHQTRNRSFSREFSTDHSKTETKVEIVDNKMNAKVTKLFPNPKNILGNIYSTVVSEKNSKEYALTPIFKHVNQTWVCSYRIKWPEDKIFSANGKSKSISSRKCALQVLEYLLENKKIDKGGKPILYNEEHVKDLIKKNKYEIFDLPEKQTDKMREIVNLHMNEIFPILSELNTKSSEEVEEVIDDEHRNIYQQRFLGYNQYKCRESTYLPVSDYKEEIINLIEQNQVVVIKGEPGCGKSTRIPQYILEGWARNADQSGETCNIVVTEPRRIAAISLAQRVASERNETLGSIVGYQVRFNSNYQRKSGRILYCTNGVLLQQFKSNLKLAKYSHVIIDEAHERDINTDLLLNMLRRISKENPKLKIIIMSATIDTTLFQKYFENSTLLTIPGFTYPVKSYFIEHIPIKLEKTKKMCENSEPPSVNHREIVDVLKYIHREKPEGAILCFLPGWEDIRKIRELIPSRNDLQVLCLHSRLQDSEQHKIFKKPPNNVRKIILATNIAESSVTIDDIVYVVDTGIHKESMLDVQKGVMCLDNYWISRSSVEQRKGRAGRVQPGECYHLYTGVKLEKMPKFSVPEILRASLTKVVLDSKAFKHNMNALEFFNDLPSPPSAESVKLALDELEDLELIDCEEQLTPLGKVVLNFQLEPKLSKTLINSVIFKCVTPIVDIVSIFSLDNEIFQSGLDMKEKIRGIKMKFAKNSDHLALMRIYEIWDEFYENGDNERLNKFYNDLLLLPHRLKTLKDLRDLHFNYLYDGLKCKVLPISDDFSDEDELVKAVLLNGVGTFLTSKNWEIVKNRLKKGTVFYTRSNQKASVTPESVNYKQKSLSPNVLLYINETRSNLRRLTLIRETSLISPIMALLFSHKKISLKNIDPSEFSPKLNSDDQVVMSLAGSNLNFLMDRRKALTIVQCKLALNNCYDHYVYQLTKGGELNVELNNLWDRTLGMLSEFFKENKV